MKTVTPWVPADTYRQMLLQVLANWETARFFTEGFDVIPTDAELNTLHHAVCYEAKCRIGGETIANSAATYMGRMGAMAKRSRPLDGLPSELLGGATLQLVARRLLGAYDLASREFPTVGLVHGPADPAIALRDTATFGWLVTSFVPAESRPELSLTFCELLYIASNLPRAATVELPVTRKELLEGLAIFFRNAAPMLCNMESNGQPHVFREHGLPGVIAAVGENLQKSLERFSFKDAV